MKRILVVLFMILGFTVLANQNKKVEYTQIRNATGILNYGGKRILIDPFFAPKESMAGFPGTYNETTKNPLIDLPMSVEKILKDINAIIITHTHEDHWDEYAQKAISKDMPLFVQNQKDADLIAAQGFKNITIIEENTKFGDIVLTKTKGQHGTDTMYKIPNLANLLGEAMGVLFQTEGSETIYLVGDTIWRKDVENVVKEYKPKIIIMNTGDAEISFDSGLEARGIIMGKLDVERMYHFAPNTKIVAVHMDTVNHGTLTRAELRTFVDIKKLDKKRVLIPNDGEKIKF